LLESINFTDYLIAVSKDVKNSIKLKKPKQIAVINNVSFFKKPKTSKEKARKTLGIKKENKMVLFIGALIEEKGVLELAKAIQLVLKKMKKVEFHFVFGYKDKKIEEKIKKIAKNNKIKLHEKVPNKRVREWFIPATDLVVLPSLWPEPCSTIVSESFSCGKAVLASNRGGYMDLIRDGINGFLAEPNRKKIAEKIVKLLKNKKLMKKVEVNALKKAKKQLKENNFVKKTLKIYERVL
jgi:glycosyltransferase involved in cell wall biosynthesis